MKKLIDIYQFLEAKSLIKKKLDHIDNLEVLDITYDSREVKESSLFFCKGKAFKEEYLIDSIKAGACAYVSEKDYDLGVTGIVVTDIRRAMVEIAAYFFDYPDRKIKIVGVTGTKGKTTTVKFLKGIFDAYFESQDKKPCGIISSMDTFDGVRSYTSSLTTPEAIPLYKNINNAVMSGLELIIIEVSSQALKYDRVRGLDFDLGLFLNIGEDHVSPSEHPSHEDYFESKLKLSSYSKKFIFNSKMEMADRVRKTLEEKQVNFETFSLEDKKDNIYASNISYEGMKSSFTANINGEKNDYVLNQPGDYNIENALAAILVATLY